MTDREPLTELNETEMSYGKPPYDIHLELRQIGGDLLAAVTGGTRSHIGAVALAEPAFRLHPVTGRRLGSDAEASAPRVSTLTAAGHKDAVLAELFAGALCEKYGVNLCCTAGVHVDGASQEEIAEMMENAACLLKRALTA